MLIDDVCTTFRIDWYVLYFLCYRQLNGHRVVVASVRAVLKIMGYEFEKTRY